MSDAIDAEMVEAVRKEESSNATIAAECKKFWDGEHERPLVLVEVATNEIRTTVTLTPAEAEAFQGQLGDAIAAAGGRDD